MSIVSIAVGWLLSGSLSVYDVLFMVVSMVEDWLFLVAWLGKVILFKVVVSLFVVGWQLWMTLVFVGVLSELALMVLSLTSVGRLCRLGRWSVAECWWVKASVLSLGMWVVGGGWRG